MFKIMQRSRDSWLDFAGGSRLEAAKCWTRAKHARSWSVMLVGALQDKKYRLAVQLPRSWNSQLSQAASLSRQPALFCKTWLFAFHSHSSINTPYTHEMSRASRENIERETLEKNKIDSSQSLHRGSSNSSTHTLFVVTSLRGSLPKPFLTIPTSVRRPFGAWEAIRKGPISYWVD